MVDIYAGTESVSATTTTNQNTHTGDTASGSLSITSSSSASRVIKSVIIVPTTGSTTYKFALKETTSGHYFIKAGMTWTGTQVMILDIPIYADTYTVEVSSASADEEFNIYVRYV